MKNPVGTIKQSCLLRIPRDSRGDLDSTMGFFARRKKEKAIRRLKSQLGVDLYEKGTYNPEKSMTYSTHISEGDDFLIVLNRKKDDHLISKEWYLYDKKMDGRKWVL